MFPSHERDGKPETNGKCASQRNSLQVASASNREIDVGDWRARHIRFSACRLQLSGLRKPKTQQKELHVKHEHPDTSASLLMKTSERAATVRSSLGIQERP